MKTTGEVMGTGPTFADAFAKAQLGAGDVTPQSGLALLSVRDADQAAAVEVVSDWYQRDSLSLRQKARQRRFSRLVSTSALLTK